jgi:hypothetical protein
MAENAAAQAFWRAVIRGYTHGNYSEQPLPDGWWPGVVQGFEAGQIFKDDSLK